MSKNNVKKNSSDTLDKLSFQDILIMCKNLYSNGYIDSESFKSIIDKHGDKTKQVVWTSERELILANWAEMSNCNIWLHERAQRYYNIKENQFIYMLIIMNGLISMITLIGITYEQIDNDETNSDIGNENTIINHGKIFALISGTCNLLNGILTGIYKKMNYNKLVESHKTACKEYKRLSANICSQLAIRRSEREMMPKYYNDRKKEYSELEEKSPPIPQRIKIDFATRFKHCNVKLPDSVQYSFEVKIYQEPNDNDCPTMNIDRLSIPSYLNNQLSERKLLSKKVSHYNNTEPDNIETDNTETNNTETNNTETDNTETNNTETDNTETDNTETDNTETNNTETNNTETNNTETNYLET